MTLSHTTGMRKSRPSILPVTVPHTVFTGVRFPIRLVLDVLGCRSRMPLNSDVVGDWRHCIS